MLFLASLPPDQARLAALVASGLALVSILAWLRARV